MSIYQKASLVQIPSGYKAADAKLYSVVPNSGDGDFTVSSDADATRVNKDGLVETTVANQARLNYNFIDGVVQPDPHLLLEPTRTNSTTYSEDFTNWGDVGVTLTPNATIAPNGALTATKFVSTANNWRKSSFFAGSSGTTYTVSVFAKLDTSTTTTTTQIEIFKGASGFVVDFNLSNQTISGTGFTNSFIEEYPNNWFRIGGTYTADGTNQILYLYPSSSYSIAGTMFFWGAQVEVGSYATSYIPTSGSAVTRTVDTCGTSDTNLINNTEGVLFVDFEFSEQGTTSLYQIPIGLYNSGGGGTQRITIDNYSGKLRIYIVSDGGTRALWDAANPISDVVANQRYKVAIRYKNGDSKSYIDGQLYKSNNGVVSGFDLVKMVFGYANFGNTLMHRGKIHQAMYFPTALTDAELIQLTSYESFGQMAKALLYTIE